MFLVRNGHPPATSAFFSAPDSLKYFRHQYGARNVMDFTLKEPLIYSNGRFFYFPQRLSTDIGTKLMEAMRAEKAHRKKDISKPSTADNKM